MRAADEVIEVADLLGAGVVFEDDPAAEWAVDIARDAQRLVRRARVAGWRSSSALGDHRQSLRDASDAVDADGMDEDAHRAVGKSHGQATDGKPVEGFENEARGERHAVGRGISESRTPAVARACDKISPASATDARPANGFGR